MGIVKVGTNNVYTDGIYKVKLIDNEIHIDRVGGRLKILPSKEYAKEDSVKDTIKNLFDYIIVLLSKKDIVLKLSGKNKIILTKDTLTLQGSLLLENVKLRDPILHNVELLNVDFSKSREVVIGFSTIRNCVTAKPMPLKIMYTSISSQHYLDKLVKKLELSGN